MSALVIVFTSSIPKFLFQVYGIPKARLRKYNTFSLLFLIEKYPGHTFCRVFEIDVWKGGLPAMAFVSFTLSATGSSLLYGKLQEKIGDSLRQIIGYFALFPSGMLVFGIAYVKCDLNLIAGQRYYD